MFFIILQCWHYQGWQSYTCWKKQDKNECLEVWLVRFVTVKQPRFFGHVTTSAQFLLSQFNHHLQIKTCVKAQSLVIQIRTLVKLLLMKFNFCCLNSIFITLQLNRICLPVKSHSLASRIDETWSIKSSFLLVWWNVYCLCLNQIHIFESGGLVVFFIEETHHKTV